MKTLTIGLVIGATLASGVGKVFQDLDGRIASLQGRAGQLKVGENLGRNFQDLRAETMRVRAEYEKTGFKSQELGDRLRSLQRETVAARLEAERYGIRIGDVARQTDSLGVAARQAEGDIGRIQARLARTQDRSVMRGQMVGALAMGAAVAVPIKIAADFEQAMANVGAVTKATGEDFDRLRRTAQDLGRDTQFSASEAAQGMKYLGMAGFETEEIIASMPGMLDLAAAGNLDLATSADVASNILSGFSLRATEMARVSDVMVATFTSSNTNITQLGDAMKYVAPAAAAVGASVEVVAAMVGRLGDAGIQGSQAGTTLRAAFQRLAAPSREATQLLDELGISVSDAEGNMRAMPDILQDIATATSRMGSAQRQAAIATLFGLEAASGMTVLMDQASSGALAEYINTLESSSGAARDTASRMMETTLGGFKRLKSAVETLSISLGSVLLPPLADAVGTIASVVGAGAALADRFPLVTKVVFGFAAAFVATKIAVLGGRMAFSYMQDGASLLVGGLQALRPSVIQANLALLRMRGGGNVLAGTLGRLRGSVGTLRSAMTTDFAAAKSLAGALITQIKSAGLAMISCSKIMLGNMVASAKAAGAALWGMAKAAIPAVIAGVKAMSATLMANPIGLAVAAIAAAAALIIWKWDTVKAFLLQIWEPIRPYWEAIGAFFSNFWASVAVSWSAPLSTLGDMALAPLAPFRFLLGHTADVMATLGSIWDIVVAGWSGIGEWFKSISDTIKVPFERFFGWFSDRIEWLGGAWKTFVGWFQRENPGGPPDASNATSGRSNRPQNRPQARHALGGIFATPHIAEISEEGPEAVVPLSPRRNALGRAIWADAGRLLGAIPPSVSGSRASSGETGKRSAFPETQNSMNIVNHITINPSSQMDARAIAREVLKLIEQSMAVAKRREYADATFLG